MSHKRLDLHQIVLASNSTSLACTSGRSFQRPSPNSYDGVREGPGRCSLNNRNLVYMIVAAAAVDLHFLSHPCQGWHTLLKSLPGPQPALIYVVSVPLFMINYLRLNQAAP